MKNIRLILSLMVLAVMVAVALVHWAMPESLLVCGGVLVALLMIFWPQAKALASWFKGLAQGKRYLLLLTMLAGALLLLLLAAGSPAKAYDLNGDNVQDYIWHHQGSGEIHYWSMYGNGSIAASGQIGTETMDAEDWELMAVDTSNSSLPRLTFRSKRTGSLAWWLLNADLTFNSTVGLADNATRYKSWRYGP